MSPRSPREGPRSPRGPRVARRETIWAWVAVALVILVGIGVAVTQQGSAPPAPTGTGTATATVGSVTSVLVLHGVVVREDTQAVPVPEAGTVTTVWVQPGQAVKTGDDLVTLTLPLPIVPVPTATSTLPPSPSPTPQTTVVKAPIDGTVAVMSVSQGQVVVAGEEMVSISPSRFDVVATVPQFELFNFYTTPQSIQATVPQGPQPFACTFISIGGNLEGRSATALQIQPVDLRCQVPVDLPVFPGVRAKVSVTTGVVDNAILLPASAVVRHGDFGVVWVVQNGKPAERRQVTLGISDGHVVQIVGGLSSGEKVLNPARPATSASPSPF